MKVLIVDDEATIRELLAFNLEKNGYEYLEAANGEEALSLAREADLILLDVMLPIFDGLEVCRRLKAEKETRDIPIIMLTAKGDELDRVLGLELGADDYCIKPFSTRELMARIKAVLRRSGEGIKNSQEQLIIGTLRMDFHGWRAYLNNEAMSLTPKEFELLKLFITNRGKAFSRDELLEKIWGYEYFGDTRTVDVHIRHLRAKLAADEALKDSLETVRGIGYRFRRS